MDSSLGGISAGLSRQRAVLALAAFFIAYSPHAACGAFARMPAFLPSM
jgi:hypothetical protein